MDKKKCQPFSLRLRFKAEFDPNWDWEIDYTVNNCYNFHMNIHLEFFSSFGVKFDRTRKNNFEMGVKYLSLIWINNHCNNKKQCKLRRLLDKLSRCRFYQFWRILILKVYFTDEHMNRKDMTMKIRKFWLHLSSCYPLCQL